MTNLSRASAATLAVLSLQACTHYETITTYGMPQETARRLVGSPMVETSSSTSIGGGFASSTWNGRHYSDTVGGFGGNSDSVTRTHCVQAAEIDYVQPTATESVVVGRHFDIANSMGLLLAGAAVYGFARMSHASAVDRYDIDVQSWNSQNDFYQMNPSFFPSPGAYPTQPGEPRGAYMAAAGIAIAGAAYLVYALTAKPHGTPMEAQQGERRYTSTEYVESSGCGLVPNG